MDHKWEFLKDTNKFHFGKPVKKYRCAFCHRVVRSIPFVLTDSVFRPYLLPQAKDGLPCLAGSWPSFSNLPDILPGINYLNILIAQDNFKV